MKILVEQIIVPFYRVKFFEALRQSLDPHNLEILAGSSSTTGDTKSFSENLSFVSSARTRLFLGGTFYGVSGFWRKALKSDVIVCTFSLRNINLYLSLVICLLTRKKKIIFWGHTHGRKKYLAILRKFSTRLGHGFICYTKEQSEEMQSAFLGLTTDVSFLGNSLYSTQQFDKIKQNQISSTDNRPMSLVYSGRLIPEKGLMELVEAFAQVKADTNSHAEKLHIIGTGILLEDLETYVKNRGLDGEIIFHGEILDDDKIGHIYSQCVASICCGYLGLNVIQALAFGLPIIFNAKAHHSPEIEACVGGFNSFQYETHDELVALISNLKHVIAEGGKSHEIHEHVRENYNTDLMASRFADFVNRVCGK